MIVRGTSRILSPRVLSRANSPLPLSSCCYGFPSLPSSCASGSLLLRSFASASFQKYTYHEIIEKFSPAKNLLDVQAISADIFADRPYLGTWKTGTYEYITYKQFDDDVAKFRDVLAKLGVGREDKVAIISSNRVEWGVGCYAAYGLGAQVVPLYEAQTTKDWEYILNDCNAKVLLVSTDKIFKTIENIKTGGRLPKLQSIICFDLLSDGVQSYSSLMSSVKNPTVKPIVPKEDDLVAIMYTSGSTGPPKGVELSHKNIMANLRGVKDVWGPIFAEKGSQSDQERTVNYLPWGHIFGFTTSFHMSLMTGASVALTPNKDSIISSCEMVKPIEITSVPLILNKIHHGVLSKVSEAPPRRQKIVKKAFEIARNRNQLLEAGHPIPFSLFVQHWIIDKLVMAKIRSQILGGKLEMLSAGGGKTSLEVLHFFEDVGLPLCEGYGMTEAAPIISMSTSPGFSRRRLGSVGRALPGCIIEIRDLENLERVPSGTEGEIFVAGDNISRGYHNLPNATAATFVKDPERGIRFLRTGDLGYLDDDGYLFISGRIKEQYKLQNGKFVSPSPIEDGYNRSIYISQCLVCGADREHNVALIVPDMTELRRWAESNSISVSSGPAELEEYSQNEQVRQLIFSELKKFDGDVNSYERVRDWTFVEAFTPENDLLTQKMSLKRHNILRRYAETIDKLYKDYIEGSVF